jgi:hypothetical protein
MILLELVSDLNIMLDKIQPLPPRGVKRITLKGLWLKVSIQIDTMFMRLRIQSSLLFGIGHVDLRIAS